jgi:hypothetical protein
MSNETLTDLTEVFAEACRMIKRESTLINAALTRWFKQNDIYGKNLTATDINIADCNVLQ